MKLFLASKANLTLDLITPLLPSIPSHIKLAFITTAAHVYEDKPWMYDDRNKLISMGFRLTDYDFTNKNKELLTRDLSQFDVIFMAGGNSYYLLKILRETGGDVVLSNLIQKGKLYIGSSAGSVILGPDLNHAVTLDHADWVPELKDYTALGIIKERIAPHYGNPKYEERYQAVINDWGNKVLPLRDNQAFVINVENQFIVESK